MADKALEAKNKGNAAFSSGDFQTAIQHFTEAISHDPSNHVLYSNRSAAYASLNKYDEALVDANKTIELKPDWSKGYGRKGTALHGLQKLEEALESYDKGLELEPTNAVIKKGRDDVEAALSSGTGDLFGGLLKGDIWTKLRTSPKTAAFCNQPDFIQIVNTIQKNPQTMTQFMSDPRVAAMLGVLLGIDLGQAGAASGGPQPMETEASSPPPQPKQQPKKEEPPKPKEPEKKLPENKKQALQEKEKGTEAYKKKDFETALNHYNKAIELDPEDMVYIINVAAVNFETKKYEETIQNCKDAIEIGRKHFADFKLIGRAFARMGNAYAKLEKYVEAIDAYNRSLTEHRTPEVLESLQKIEKLKKEKEVKDYINPEISLQEKEKGNEFFKKNLYPEAIKAYTEAIKRNPEDHTIYSNRSGAYTKLGEYPLAVKDADDCIALKPDFVKAYIRKGNAHYVMKDYHKSLEAFEKGLKLDENNTELKEGLKKTMMAINMQNYSGDEKSQQERAAKAAQDPEIQTILRDPVMIQILNDMQDPKAVSNHMSNPLIAAKIQKLIAAGVLRTG